METTTVRFSRAADLPDLDPSLETLARGLTLGAGELAAIGLVQRETGCLLLTDDAAARLAAEGLGVDVHGTMGVILRSLRIGRQTAGQVVALLEAIPARSTLHIRRHLLDEAIREVKERHSG